DQPGAVAGAGGFAEQFGEALAQLAHAQTLQRRDLLDDVHFHGGSPFLGFRQRSTRVDSEPLFAEKRKAIRDKKERFLERKDGREVVVPIRESASGADPEWSGGGRKSYGRESQAPLRDPRSAISRPPGKPSPRTARISGQPA